MSASDLRSATTAMPSDALFFGPIPICASAAVTDASIFKAMAYNGLATRPCEFVVIGSMSASRISRQ